MTTMAPLRQHSDAAIIAEEIKKWKGCVYITKKLAMRSRAKFNSPLFNSLFIIYTLSPSKMNLREIK